MTQLLTRDGTPASRFIFGTMQFGGSADASESRALFETCRAAGITHFDTAYVYTGGQSETLLGGMIGQDRDALLIASKVGHDGGAGVDSMSAQFDASRKRLGLDEVDLLYLHKFDPETDLRETLGWFAKQKESGTIRYVGLSNAAAWEVMKALRVADEFGVAIDILQPMYNLVKRQAEVEILPMCADQGLAVAPYSPLGGGLLTGKYARGSKGRLSDDTRYAARYGQDWMHRTAADLADLADTLGVTAATLAVAWVARHPNGLMPIISARNAAQLEPSLAAMQFDMDDALYKQITALSVTPAPATDRLEEA